MHFACLSLSIALLKVVFANGAGSPLSTNSPLLAGETTTMEASFARRVARNSPALLPIR